MTMALHLLSCVESILVLGDIQTDQEEFEVIETNQTFGKGNKNFFH